MKIQAETMKRIFADMTAMWNAVPKAKQDEMREALASGNITITNLGWQLYHLAFADRNYDDSHPRYQTRARILPLAPFPMYPDGANDDHMATMFKRFELPPVTPPAVSCINNGCGLKFDPTEPETRSLETLKPFAMLYCPKHRIPATPPVVIEAITPADAYHTERFFQAESLHGSEAPPADEASQDEPEEEETRERITCDQCELLAINGVCCHEIGCPNMGARWDAENREWIKQRKCFECGCTIDADDPCCSAPFEEEEEDTPSPGQVWNMIDAELALSCEKVECPGCGRSVTTTAGDGVPGQALRNCDECGKDFFVDVSSRPLRVEDED